MIMHIDYAPSKDCINTWSYGMICVHCGCCSRNPNYRDRLINQIRYYKECLKENQNFSNWSDDEYLIKIQKKNLESNNLYFKRKIRRCKKLLRCTKGRSRYAEQKESLLQLRKQ